MLLACWLALQPDVNAVEFEAESENYILEKGGRGSVQPLELSGNCYKVDLHPLSIFIPLLLSYEVLTTLQVLLLLGSLTQQSGLVP
jgi:hypothetical protein